MTAFSPGASPPPVEIAIRMQLVVGAQAGCRPAYDAD
jgi:hypothetical protein